MTASRLAGEAEAIAVKPASGGRGVGVAPDSADVLALTQDGFPKEIAKKRVEIGIPARGADVYSHR